MHDALLPQALRARLFHRVPTALVESTLEMGNVRGLEAGTTLLRAGQENTTIYLVLSGALDVRLADKDEPVTVGSGECVGVRSVIDQSGAAGDVVAAEPTTVLEISRGDLWTLINTSAEAARNILVMLAGRVRQRDGGIAGTDQLPSDQAAAVDALTGLRNRAWLDEAYKRQMQRTLREREPIALLMIDIDGFAEVSDEHGPLIGDAVLRRIARVLATGLRPQDLLARHGGERFAVLLPNAETELAASIAERLRQAVRAVPLESSDERLPTSSVSIGVAIARDAVSLEELVTTATAALDRAKAAGRDRISV
jgi:diguanylate cyclase (GGDEF)-like protein